MTTKGNYAGVRDTIIITAFLKPASMQSSGSDLGALSWLATSMLFAPVCWLVGGFQIQINTPAAMGSSPPYHSALILQSIYFVVSAVNFLLKLRSYAIKAVWFFHPESSVLLVKLSAQAFSPPAYSD